MAAATVDEIIDALNSYSDYEEVGSVSRARSYITAARRFLALPSTSSEQGSAMGYTPQLIRDEMAIARSFIAANDGPSQVRFLGVEYGFRGFGNSGEASR